MSSHKGEFTYHRVHCYPLQKGRFNTLNWIITEWICNKSHQKCDGQHEKTVLSHKGTARHAFNAVATNLTAVKNKKHIQWPISYIHNGIFHTLAKGDGDWEKISGNLMPYSRKITTQSKRLAKILRHLIAQSTFTKPQWTPQGNRKRVDHYCATELLISDFYFNLH